ncbi:MAG: hypothetical protein R3C56_11860 [Pirellulaceae bacterium]
MSLHESLRKGSHFRFRGATCEIVGYYERTANAADRGYRPRLPARRATESQIEIGCGWGRHEPHCTRVARGIREKHSGIAIRNLRVQIGV